MYQYYSWKIKDQLVVTCYFISLLMCSTCFGHSYIHHQDLATILLNNHIGRVFLVRWKLEFRCGWVGVVSMLQTSACNTTPNLDLTQKCYVDLPLRNVVKNEWILWTKLISYTFMEIKIVFPSELGNAHKSKSGLLSTTLELCKIKYQVREAENCKNTKFVSHLWKFLIIKSFNFSNC